MKFRPLLLAGVLVCGASQVYAEGDYRISIGAEMSQGDYDIGATSTTVAFPLGLYYSGERFAWSLSLPWQIVSAPEDVVIGAGGIQGGRRGSSTSSTSTSVVTRTRSGMGDAGASVGAWLFEEGDVTPWMGATGKVKFGTADTDLGTGQNDYALQVEMGKGVVNGYVGYRFLGDTDTVAFNDVAYGALGFGFGDVLASWGVEYFHEQAAVEGGTARKELSLYASRTLAQGMRVQGYILHGLSKASADWGGGFSLSFPL